MAFSMERWQNKIAVVTGASAGIGAAIAIRLAEEGLQVVGLARRVERVQELSKNLKNPNAKLIARKCDMTEEKDILESFKWIKENLGPVSILINNAGIIQYTNLIDGDTQKWKKLLDTNILGLCIASREAIKQMRDEKIDGHIINMNSICGHKHIYFPEVNLYAASKFAVTNISETLRQELTANNLKIKVTSISPGTVISEIVETNNFPDSNVLGAKRNAAPSIEATDIADGVVYVLSTGPKVAIPELTIQPVGEVF